MIAEFQAVESGLSSPLVSEACVTLAGPFLELDGNGGSGDAECSLWLPWLRLSRI